MGGSVYVAVMEPFVDELVFETVNELEQAKSLAKGIGAKGQVPKLLLLVHECY